MSELRDQVVVVGSGFAGLSAAILLSRLGKRVTLVEAERQIGGMTRSYTRGAIDCPVGVHYFGAAGRGELLGQFFDLLGIREALRLHRSDEAGIIDRYVFDDSTFDLPAGVEAFVASLRRHFPAHRPAVDFVATTLESALAHLRIRRDGHSAPLAGPPANLEVAATTLLRQHGCPDDLLRILSMQGCLTGSSLDEAPIMLPFTLLASLLMSSWELGCTGAEMADALAAQLVANGGTIVAGDAVNAIDVEDGRAAGVRLKSGTVLPARHVVSGVHIKTLARLLPVGAWPAPARAFVESAHDTSAVFSVVALVDKARCPPLPFNVYRTWATDRSRIETVWIQARESPIPGRTRLVVVGPSECNDWKPWLTTKTGCRGDAYQARKAHLAAQFLERAEEALGPLGTSEILDTWTPLTLRDWVNAPAGSAFGICHAARDWRNLIMTRSAIDGLSVVGQTALAPGLVGVAMAVLRSVRDVIGRPRFREYLSRELTEQDRSME